MFSQLGGGYYPRITINYMVPLFSDRYLSELLAERHKLSPFVPVLPHSYRLLNQGEQLFVVNLLHSLLEKRVRVQVFVVYCL